MWSVHWNIPTIYKYIRQTNVGYFRALFTFDSFMYYWYASHKSAHTPACMCAPDKRWRVQCEEYFGENGMERKVRSIFVERHISECIAIFKGCWRPLQIIFLILTCESTMQRTLHTPKTQITICWCWLNCQMLTIYQFISLYSQRKTQKSTHLTFKWAFQFLTQFHVLCLYSSIHITYFISFNIIFTQHHTT